MADNNLMKSVFVTVGTTSFDKLIQVVSSDAVVEMFQKLGYSKLELQIGRGEYEPRERDNVNGVELTYFRYKDSIKDHIEQADLVISHAGAGSVLETLQAGRPLLVVINEDLMDNHQLEVAYQLHKDGHLYYCTPSQLLQVLHTLDISKLKPFESGQPQKFASFLDKVMGYS